MINVYASGSMVGNLFNSDIDNRQYYFNYEKNTINKNAISLTMPVITDPYQYWGKLHPIFEMNLPEGELLIRLKQIYQKHITHFSDLDLLKIVGRNQIGRLTFNHNPFTTSVIDEIGLNLNEFKTYTGSEDLLEKLLNKYANVSGISGVQPKIMVLDTSDNKKLSALDKLSHRDTTHIIKSWKESTYPELATNEYFCMCAAKYAGLKTPEMELTNEGKFLILKRFDYINDTYYGFEDFCVLLGKSSSDKYDASYEKIARCIRNNLTMNSIVNLKPALYDYFKSIVLSICLRNGDAHLKNYGLLYKDTESIINLAPIYDIVTTNIYIPEDTMALTLNGTKRWATKKELITFATNTCLMSQVQINQAIDEVYHGIQKAKQELINHTNVTPTFYEIGSQLKNTWDNAWKDFYI